MALISRKKKPKKQKPPIKQRISRHFQLKRQFKTMNKIIALNKSLNLGLHILPTIVKRSRRYSQIQSLKILDASKMDKPLLEALEQELTLQKANLCYKGFVTQREAWVLILGPDGAPNYYLVNFSNIKKEKPAKI